MRSSLNVTKRALTGPICSERDFDQKVFAPRLDEALKKCEIKFDPAALIPAQDSMADDLFAAAMDFYADVGTYCLDTERIVKFDEDEIKEGLRSAPSQATFGEELDAGVFRPRQPESTELPWCFIGAGGAPVSSEEVFLSLVQGYGEIALADAITTPELTMVDGFPIRVKTPFEIFGSIRNAVLARDALRRAGRPGLPIMNALATAASDTALIAALHPMYGLRPSDGYFVATMAELKTNYELMNKACALTSLGGRIGTLAGCVMGGYCGGPEGTALSQTAYHAHGILVNQATYHLNHPAHMKYISNSGPEMLWLISMYAQAVSRNTHLLSLNLNYTSAGPCTDMALYEIAAQVITAVVSGVSIEAVGLARAVYVDHLTPIEPKFAAEVAHAAAGMKRTQANEIVKTLVKKYVDKIPNPPPGQRYQDCFDARTGTPSRECLAIYSRVKKELEDLGLEFKY
jgi:methylamine--corrinoid protein Co-methyltransferase